MGTLMLMHATADLPRHFGHNVEPNSLDPDKINR